MPLDADEVKDVARCVRHAFEKARDAGEFHGHRPFDAFPKGCCGMASTVLGEYLRLLGVDTIWVSATRGDWTHAWLVLNDSLVQPRGRYVGYAAAPAEVQQVLSTYGAQLSPDGSDNRFYLDDDLRELTVIDITGDQFSDCNEPVYVGPLDTFHRSFSCPKASPSEGLQTEECVFLYAVMRAYL